MGTEIQSNTRTGWMPKTEVILSLSAMRSPFSHAKCHSNHLHYNRHGGAVDGVITSIALTVTSFPEGYAIKLPAEGERHFQLFRPPDFQNERTLNTGGECVLLTD
ncbi:hypothetical protein TcWFU_004351 [Taenia crassiceps]|uniref:Uncharacterized protein n=1 Tax=Taenia crassiceps TaxID=6207 RepID=A0ABR4QAR4_9CEST